MCHPSLDLPFQHPSIFHKQQLSYCRAVTVPGVTDGQRSCGSIPWEVPGVGGESSSSWKCPSKAGAAGIHTSTAPTCQSQSSSSTCPVLLVIPVIPMALSTAWQEEPVLLQSVPTALFGDGPSHSRSHDQACRQRHSQGIPPGHEAVWAGGRGAADPGWKRSHRSQQEEPDSSRQMLLHRVADVSVNMGS